MQKPMIAALLALTGAVAFSSIASAKDCGQYFIKSSEVLSAPIVRTESAVIAPATTTTTTTTIVESPLMDQVLVMPAVIARPVGFSMDAAALRLYRGPRLENTLTMPDSTTFLRP